MGVCEVVNNVHVFGLEDSIRASKYPMAVDTTECTPEITPKVVALGQSDRGSGHDQFLTGIVVQFDLTFSIKAWVEAERYHFLDFVSSQSTMHRITKLDPYKQCNEYVDEEAIRLVKRKIDFYNANPTPEGYLGVLYNVPVGFMLTARMTTNYRQLKTICHQRCNHRLPEWRQFCDWIKTLPYAKELIIGEESC